MRNKLLLAFVLCMLFAGIASAAIISRPTKTTGGTSYTDGTVPHASDFNGDFDTLYTDYNGNITNANISPTAAIAASKISPNFGNNVQVTTAASPCFINIDSSLGVDLKQWRICQNGGTLSIATYTDAGAVIITPLSIARASGNLTVVGSLTGLTGLTLSSGNLFLSSGTITASALTGKSFLFSGIGGVLTTTSAPTNGQMLIGNTGNNPTLGTITGTATHVCTSLGAGTFALDFCANPTLTSPVLAGTPTGSWTSMNLTTPVLSGTITGTYTLGGSPTIGAGTVLATPVLQTPSVTTGAMDLQIGQIAFPASQNPSAGANTLDDYKEGTWTPRIRFNANETGITYGTQQGEFIKIGRLVFMDFRITLTNNGVGVGNADIVGLPISNLSGVNSMIGKCRWQNLVTSFVDVLVVADGGSASMSVYGLTAAAASYTTRVTDTDFGNTGTLDCNITVQATN